MSSLFQLMRDPMRSFGPSTTAWMAALVFAATLPDYANADITLSPRGCQSYAAWAGNLVWARDLGADKEKTRDELVALDKKMPSSMFALMLKDFDELWKSTASWEEVMMLVLQDCIVGRGMYHETLT